MNPQFVRNYVPGESFLQGKEEMPGRICREDFAILLPAEDYMILASRGKQFSGGGVFPEACKIAKSELTFLEQSLPIGGMIVLAGANGAFIVFPDLFRETGLLAVLHPYGEIEKVRDVLVCLPDNECLLSPKMKSLASSGRITDELCETLVEQITSCKKILFASQRSDFRQLGAQIAWFSGCRTNLISLPVGSLPIPTSFFRSLTAFLFCLFLSLRGTDSQGPTFRVREITQNFYHLSAFQMLPSSAPTIPDFSFLRLPCFSNIRLEKNKDSFTLQILVPHQQETLYLNALSRSLCLTIDFVLQ